jgi:hypothetical protein
MKMTNHFEEGDPIPYIAETRERTDQNPFLSWIRYMLNVNALIINENDFVYYILNSISQNGGESYHDDDEIIAQIKRFYPMYKREVRSRERDEIFTR